MQSLALNLESAELFREHRSKDTMNRNQLADRTLRYSGRNALMWIQYITDCSSLDIELHTVVMAKVVPRLSTARLTRRV